MTSARAASPIDAYTSASSPDTAPTISSATAAETTDATTPNRITSDHRFPRL
jgi:hypothetical protein